MEKKDNILRRIGGILSNPAETFEKICQAPNSWTLSFLLLVGNLTLFFVFLAQIPTAVKSLLIAASLFPVYLIYLIFVGFMVVFALVFLIIISLVYIIGKRLRKSREEHRSRKTIFNIYVYSLTPMLLLVSQVPFMVIFGGHYALFNLQIFFYFLLGIVIGWHVTLLHRGIRTNSDISPKRAKLITGLYIGIIGGLAGFAVYATLYLPFSISWIGMLY